jgi:hypothetical protein
MLIYCSKRCCILPCTSKYDRFTARISVEITGVLRRIRTVIYGRNTIPTKRVSHGPYTVVIVMYTNLCVRVNGGFPSFAIVVTLDLGSNVYHGSLLGKFFFITLEIQFGTILRSIISFVLFIDSLRCSTVLSSI